MKTLSQFQCEICNTVYKSETECKVCEDSHYLPVAIKAYKFNSYKNDGEYPKYIDVAMENGKIIRYKR